MATSRIALAVSCWLTLWLRVPTADHPRTSGRKAQRVIAALVVGAAAAFVHYIKIKAVPNHPGDFGLAWFGARAMLHGGNPYELIGPGLVYDWPWRLIYPLTAMAAALPFALLPQIPATLAFVFASGALLAYSVTRDHWYPLLMCTSAAFLIAAGAAQWSPLFTAAMGVPPIAMFFAAKPTVGFALALAGSRAVRKFAVIGGVILVVVSLAMFPRWPLEWYRSLSTATQVAPPLFRFGGITVLIALLRWKRWDARLIVALACVPQTGSWYEILPLFLIPANRTEMMALVAISSSGWLMQDFVMTAANETQYNQQVGAMMVALGYLPAVIMVLRRPNERVHQ